MNIQFHVNVWRMIMENEKKQHKDSIPSGAGCARLAPHLPVAVVVIGRIHACD